MENIRRPDDAMKDYDFSELNGVVRVWRKSKPEEFFTATWGTGIPCDPIDPDDMRPGEDGSVTCYWINSWAMGTTVTAVIREIDQAGLLPP